MINIYLACKQITIASLSKKSRISFPDLESIRNEKISKAFVPRSWSLLKPIECLRELIDMVGLPVILEARGLFHVYLLLDWSIKEDALHVHLEQLKGMVSRRSKSLLKIQTCDLGITFCQKSSLVLVITPCSSCLLWNTHLVPTTFCFGRGTRLQTSFLLKLLSSS